MNISLPCELGREVEKVVKSGKYATKSEFFRHLVRQWQEEEALDDIHEAKAEIRAGKGRILRSLKDLR